MAMTEAHEKELRAKIRAFDGAVGKMVTQVAHLMKELSDAGKSTAEFRGGIFTAARFLNDGMVTETVASRFFGAPFIIRELARLPLAQQNRVANEGLVVYDTIRRTETRKHVEDLTRSELRFIINEGKILTGKEQKKMAKINASRAKGVGFSTAFSGELSKEVRLAAHELGITPQKFVRMAITNALSKK